MISGLPQSRIPSFNTVGRSAPKASVAAATSGAPENPGQDQFDAVWQSKAKFQQAMQVYQGLDQAEIMQDV